jgi:hypothetical protein
MIVKPILQALLLADYVYTDLMTQKKVIAGTFNQMQFPQFPAQFPGMPWVYAALTNMQGNFMVTLRYSDLDSNEALLESAPLPNQSDDRLTLVELVLQLPTLPAPHAGVYAMELLVDSELIGQLRVRVQELDVKPPQSPEEGHE